jgi:dehydrogenase/reductase SDR family protein 7B
MGVEQFKGKVVWITGASSGIGEALAVQFAKSGALLVLSSRRLVELERVKNRATLGDDQCMLLSLDLGAPNNYDLLVKEILTRFGKIDVLINNGGISQRSLAIETPLEIDRRIMEVNFFGAVALTKAVLPVMQKQKGGRIVAISSIAGKFGFHLRSAYAASKFAMAGFFESLRFEIEKDGVQVHLVYPGKIKTDISLHALKADGSVHGKMDKSQELGITADECARIIIQSMVKGKMEILIGRKELIPVYLKRISFSLFYFILKKVKPE